MAFSSFCPKLALFLVFLPFSTPFATDPSPHFDHFDSWCKFHGKIYATEEEKLFRFKVFQDNLAFISLHNSLANSTYTLAPNAFADLTFHEFRATKLGLSPNIASVTQKPPAEPLRGASDVPASIDWRKKGAVTPVKDQGSCGDCWAFSATGAIEGINKIVTKSLVSLSEQELCDCDRTYNIGCGGGLMDYAFEWAIQNHGIDTEEDYPYKGAQGTCLKEKLKRRVVTIDSYSDVPPNNERQLLQAVAIQPVSVGICGSERAFQLYSKGIFTGPCSTSLDHAALIVGYGSENGMDYWIVKNSWGPHWGMGGYINMLRNGGNPEGTCGINKLASYPIKTSPNPPPPPSPVPVRCNLLTYCPAGNTCCCIHHFLGLCLSWSCCDLPSAVCCKDRRYCCPHDYPICESRTKQCLKMLHSWFSSFRDYEYNRSIHRQKDHPKMIISWLLRTN